MASRKSRVSDAGSVEGQRAFSPTSEFITVELSPAHQLDHFRCARDPEAVSYLQKELWPQLHNHCGAAYVRESRDDPTRIDGFYHLAGSSLKKGEAQNPDQKRWVSDSPVPVYVIAYVARDDRAIRGLGAALVIDAAHRGRSLFPTWGLVLFARRPALVPYYRGLGFKVIRAVKQRLDAHEELPDQPVMMYAKYEWIIP